MTQEEKIAASCVMQYIVTGLRRIMTNKRENNFSRCKYFDMVFEDIYGVENFGKTLITSPSDRLIANQLDDFGITRLLFLFNDKNVTRQLDQLVELRETLAKYDKMMDKYQNRDRIAPKKDREEYRTMKRAYGLCIKRFRATLGIKKAPTGMGRFDALNQLLNGKKKRSSYNRGGNTLFSMDYDESTGFYDDDEYDDDSYRMPQKTTLSPRMENADLIPPGSELDQMIQKALQTAGLSSKKPRRSKPTRKPVVSSYDDDWADEDDLDYDSLGLSSFHKPADLDTGNKDIDALKEKQDDLAKKMEFVVNMLSGQATPQKAITPDYIPQQAIPADRQKNQEDVRLENLQKQIASITEGQQKLANAIIMMSDKKKKEVQQHSSVMPFPYDDDDDIDEAFNDDDIATFEFEALIQEGERDEETLTNSLLMEGGELLKEITDEDEKHEYVAMVADLKKRIHLFCNGRPEVFGYLFKEAALEVEPRGTVDMDELLDEMDTGQEPYVETIPPTQSSTIASPPGKPRVGTDPIKTYNAFHSTINDTN